MTNNKELDFNSGETVSPPNFDPANRLDTSGSIPKVVAPKDFTHQMLWSTLAGGATKKITADQKEIIDFITGIQDDTYSAVINGTHILIQKIIKL